MMKSDEWWCWCWWWYSNHLRKQRCTAVDEGGRDRSAEQIGSRSSGYLSELCENLEMRKKSGRAAKGEKKKKESVVGNLIGWGWMDEWMMDGWVNFFFLFFWCLDTKNATDQDILILEYGWDDRKTTKKKERKKKRWRNNTYVLYVCMCVVCTRQKQRSTRMQTQSHRLVAIMQGQKKEREKEEDKKVDEYWGWVLSRGNVRVKPVKKIGGQMLVSII